jgi:hypothetical protein
MILNDVIFSQYSGRSRTMADGKQRHGCLTAWLVLMIIANSLTAIIYLLATGGATTRLSALPIWALGLLAVGSLFNVICAIALLRWKIWGFWGFLGVAALALVVNVTLGLNIVQIVLGLVGVGVLYGVLQIGGEKKGWDQLE